MPYVVVYFWMLSYHLMRTGSIIEGVDLLMLSSLLHQSALRNATKNIKNNKIYHNTSVPIYFLCANQSGDNLLVTHASTEENDQKCNPNDDAFSSSSWIKLYFPT